ncbi:MAG: trigger factor [Erysipelotrichaceae bacterium]|nr:trigger factor [Erysipelotrichaceae bacterium]
MSEYKKIENAKAELTCTLEGEEWEKAKKTAFRKLASKVEIKGFRKGQAPKNLVNKYINNQEVLLDAAESLAQKAMDDAIKEHELTLIDRPELKIDEMLDEKCVLTFSCPVLPDVKLGDYKALKYEVEDVKVEDKEVNDEVARNLDRKADLELKDEGEVEDGDTVVIDFEGFLDDVPFEGGKADNHELLIGSHSFIPGFEDQLIGMKAEEEKDINVVFPEDYHAEELKGKPARFHVTVHEIKKKVLPEYNDEFVKELKIDDVETVEAYENYIRSNIEQRKKDQATQDAENKLIDELSDIVEAEIPQVMIDSELQSMIQNYETRLMQQGISLSQFMQLTGQTIDGLKETMKEDALKRVKINLGLAEIVKKEKIAISPEDVNAEYERMADLYGLTVEELHNYVPEDTLLDDLKLQKALDLLKNSK